jgi:small subunit ribosomal protein S2
MGVPIIGLLDTDCDPDTVDIVIPGNDDSLKSVRLLISYLIEAVEEGAASARDRNLATVAAERTETTTGDEPRPTRGNKLPGKGEKLPGAKAAEAPAAAEEAPVAEAPAAAEEAPASEAPAAAEAPAVEAPTSTDAPAS